MEIGYDMIKTHAGEQLFPRDYLNTVLRKFYGFAKWGPHPFRLRSSDQHSQSVGEGGKACCRNQFDKDAGLNNSTFSNCVNKG